jgi:hypothetical protein
MNWLQKTWTRMFERTYEKIEQEEQMKSEEWLDNKYDRIDLFYSKRYADIGFKIPMPMNVCDLIKPLITLKDDSNLKSIWYENIQYVSDNFKVNGLLDYWQLPNETWVLRKGDCEDSSTYRVSKAKSNGVGNNLFVALGFYGNEGHAFPVIVDYKNDKIKILEATNSVYNPIDYEGSKYQIYYIFNERFAWVVNSSVVFGKKVSKDFGVIYAKRRHSKGSKKTKVSKKIYKMDRGK